MNTFSMPLGTTLEALTSQNWNMWLATITAILQPNEVDAILVYDMVPNGVDADDWALIQKKTKAYLCLYCAAGIHSTFVKTLQGLGMLNVSVVAVDARVLWFNSSVVQRRV